MKKLPLLFFVFIFIALTPINLVLAEDGNSNTDSGKTIETKEQIKTEIETKRKEIQQNMLERQKETKDRIASRSAEHKEKLEVKKLEICEKRKENITKRADNISSRAEKHFNRFGELVDKIDKFYTEKIVPKGVVVANYATLKADIAKTKADAQTAIAAAKAKIGTFDCAGEDPKGDLEEFKAETKTVHAALKDYRTAIKNFILAIKASVEERKAATSSAEFE